MGSSVNKIHTRISANADGPHDAALRKINHIALHAECNSQETSNMCAVKLKLKLGRFVVGILHEQVLLTN